MSVMRAPTTVAVPHRLGREEARRRMHARIGELPRHLPAGIADVRSSWPSEDRMTIEVTAMGQRISAICDVEEKVIRVTMTLPLMLSFLSGAIAGAIERKGAALLEDDKGT